jgi:lysyl-tRNA synthetase class 2
MLVEWYRCGWQMAELMQETAELARRLLSLSAEAPLESLSYAEAFQRELDLDPLAAPLQTLRERASGHGMDRRLAAACGRDELCDWLIAVAIGPRLGLHGLTFLHHYPASQAALARLDPQDPRVALRFELYHRGVELANGFEELTDPAEQAKRFAAEQHTRQQHSAPAHAADERLLAALAHGLPPVSGVALGFDRALMLRVGAGTLAEVLPFPIERA